MIHWLDQPFSLYLVFGTCRNSSIEEMFVCVTHKSGLVGREMSDSVEIMILYGVKIAASDGTSIATMCSRVVVRIIQGGCKRAIFHLVRSSGSCWTNLHSQLSTHWTLPCSSHSSCEFCDSVTAPRCTNSIHCQRLCPEHHENLFLQGHSAAVPSNLGRSVPIQHRWKYFSDMCTSASQPQITLH